MRKVLVLVCLLGCAKKDDYPVGPGGPGGPGGNGSDGGSEATDGGVSTTISGRVCVTPDLRNTDMCSTAAGSLKVELGSSPAATTDANGNFTIDIPAGTNLQWRVTGASIVTSITEFSPERELYAIKDTDYASYGAIIDADKGSIVVHLVRGGHPLSDATATVSPNGGIYQPFYDGQTATAWQQAKTQANGVVWLPDAAAGAQTMTITPTLGTPHTESGILVEAGAIRFATVDVP